MAALKSCSHEWERAQPVVVVVGDPLAEVKGGKTYNATCSLCGAREWLHWPVRAYGIEYQR